MIYLVVGVPASGKSWVCEQLQGRMRYVHHDLHVGASGEAYVEALVRMREIAGSSPVLGECPFSVRDILDPLLQRGLVVEPVYIVEPWGVLSERYFLREHKPIPVARDAQQNTYARRAAESGAFSGTSAEVLDYLLRRC